jgi:cytochrome b subunit of formate dehydrogenase
LALYETVIKYVLAEKVKQLESEDANSIGADSSKKADNSSSTRYSINKKSVYLGATVVGTAIAITGLCCNKSTITSFGIISAIIGGFLLYNTSKK